MIDVTMTLEQIMETALDSIKADFIKYENRFLDIMKGIEDTHGEDVVKPYMDKYHELKKWQMGI